MFIFFLKIEKNKEIKLTRAFSSIKFGVLLFLKFCCLVIRISQFIAGKIGEQ